MTVLEFMRAYFPAPKVRGLIVQQNGGDGKLRVLYASPSGYDERYVRPGVRDAQIWRWGVDMEQHRVWITVRSLAQPVQKGDRHEDAH